MSTVTILRGLPASGKTTFALDLVETQGYKRVNRDELRAMIDNGHYSPENELLIKAARNVIVRINLESGNDVVVDDTNLYFDTVKDIYDIAISLGADVRVVDIDTPLEECIRRDAMREKPVGEEAIRMLKECAERSTDFLHEGKK